MSKYLISFPAPAMDIPDEDMAAVGDAARAVIREAKAAGVYVFGGGINEDVAPLMVAADRLRLWDNTIGFLQRGQEMLRRYGVACVTWTAINLLLIGTIAALSG